MCVRVPVERERARCTYDEDQHVRRQRAIGGVRDDWKKARQCFHDTLHSKVDIQG